MRVVARFIVDAFNVVLYIFSWKCDFYIKNKEKETGKEREKRRKDGKKKMKEKRKEKGKKLRKKKLKTNKEINYSKDILP